MNDGLRFRKAAGFPFAGEGARLFGLFSQGTGALNLSPKEREISLDFLAGKCMIGGREEGDVWNGEKNWEQG